MKRDISRLKDPRSVVVAPPDLLSSRCENCWIVEEADHRIANHLAMLAGLVQQKANELSHHSGDLKIEQVKFALQSVRVQIVVTGRLHRALSSARRTPVLILSDYLRELCTSLVSLAPGEIEFVEDFKPDCFIAAAKVLPLSCMVAEVLTNAIKHGGAAERACQIRVGCQTTGEGGVIVEVADNGPGLPTGFDPGADGGFGFQLIRDLSKQLGASIAFNSDAQGVRFQVIVPADPAE